MPNYEGSDYFYEQTDMTSDSFRNDLNYFRDFLDMVHDLNHDELSRYDRTLEIRIDELSELIEKATEVPDNQELDAQIANAKEVLEKLKKVETRLKQPAEGPAIPPEPVPDGGLEPGDEVLSSQNDI